MTDIYYPVAGDTLPILFSTYDGGTGASITLTGLAVTDIEIYKDGSVTQRASDSGYTLLDTDGIDFDSITGIHGFSIDLSDDDDAGFYEVGPWYHVVVSSVTVDGQTVNFIPAAFRIVSATRGLAGTALPDAAADGAGGLPVSDAGGLDLDAQIGTDIDAILADTNELQTDDTPGALATIEGKVDTIDGIVDDILLDTAEIGAAGAGLTEAGGDGDHLTVLATQASVDTVDDFLDTEIAAIKAKTDQLTFTVANQVDANALSVDEDEILDDALADSVPADGALPTVRQALYMILQFLTERSVSSTTVTVNKVDGSTSLMTFTLDDDTNPTSITRAS